MNITKLMALCVAFVMIFCVLATGCGKNADDTAQNNAVTDGETIENPQDNAGNIDTETNTPADDGKDDAENADTSDTSESPDDKENVPDDSGESTNESEGNTEDTPGDTKDEETDEEDTEDTSGGDDESSDTGSEQPDSGTEGAVTYESYNAMSGEKQQEFIDSFDSIGDFVAWYNDAKAEYEAMHPGVEIGNGDVIDGSELVD